MSKDVTVDVADTCVVIRGARQNNLKNVTLAIPRGKLVAFAGVSGSGKSSLAFETIFAEAQTRLLESLSPFERAHVGQIGAPDCDEITGLPVAFALRQKQARASARSTLGSVTQISDFVRMLYSRVGVYPEGQKMLLAADFSPNTPRGACKTCQGTGYIYRLDEADMVPDPSLSIKDGAIVGWTRGWHGHKFMNILASLNFDVEAAWSDLSQKDRDWILFTEEEPSVPIYPELRPDEIKKAIAAGTPPRYMGTFNSVEKYLRRTLSKAKSSYANTLTAQICPDCHGAKINKAALQVTIGGFSIAQLNAMHLSEVREILIDLNRKQKDDTFWSEGKAAATSKLTEEIISRITILQDLSLGHLAIERATNSISGGELQRIKIAAQARTNLFQVLYILDEPASGLHPRDVDALLGLLDRLGRAGNSVFIVEHNLQVIRRADWVVEVGPVAGREGGRIIFNGTLDDLRDSASSATAPYLRLNPSKSSTQPRHFSDWLTLRGVSLHNLVDLDAAFPVNALTAVTGASGAGKSTLVSSVLYGTALRSIGRDMGASGAEDREDVDHSMSEPFATKLATGFAKISHLVKVDQQPIGRSTRSVIATYVEIFDRIRAIFAATSKSKEKKFSASRFSFNAKSGCCPTCQGEGTTEVTLHFMAPIRTVCTDCNGSRYNRATLEVEVKDKNIADVLEMTIDDAAKFFEGYPDISKSLILLQDIGLGYLRMGQSTPDLSGGEAQRVKLAAALKRVDRVGGLYLFDEPCTGLHPKDADILMSQLRSLVDAGNTVVMVEHDMRIVAQCDWVIDLDNEEGAASIASCGTPRDVAHGESVTAPFLRAYIG